MKTLIVYAGKYGACAEIAKRLANQMKDAKIFDLQKGTPKLADFDCVIVGSAVYAGMFRKEAKDFLVKQAEVLQGKKLGIYYSGMDSKKEKEVLDANVPKEILQAAKVARCLGGIYDPAKTGFMERVIMKTVAKQSEYHDTINNGGIEQFVQVMQ